MESGKRYLHGSTMDTTPLRACVFALRTIHGEFAGCLFLLSPFVCPAEGSMGVKCGWSEARVAVLSFEVGGGR